MKPSSTTADSPSPPVTEKKRKRGFRFVSVVETIVAIAFMLFLNKSFLPQYHGFVSIHPHPFWLIVILISVRYGFRESILAAFLVSVVYSLYIFFPESGKFYFSTLKLFSQFKEPILFFIVSGVISEYTDHLNKRNEWLQDQLLGKKKEMDLLEEKNIAQVESLKILENRIVTQLSNVHDLIRDLSKTKLMTPEEIIVHLLDMCIHQMDIGSCSYWVMENGRFERKAQRQRESVAPMDIPPETDIVLTDALKNKHVATASDFLTVTEQNMDSALSYMAGAILMESGECRGVIRVESMPFIRYNPYNFKLFRTMLELWGSALNERMRLDSVHQQSIFNEELGLFNYFYFQARFEQEFNRAREYSFPLSLSLVRINNYRHLRLDGQRGLRVTLARMFSDGATELDLVSLYRDDDTFAVVFPCMAAVDARKKITSIIQKISGFEFQPYTENPDQYLSLMHFTADYQIGMKTPDELIRSAEEGLNNSVAGKK